MAEYEVLFRGKRTDNGEWVEGCGIISTENWVSIFNVVDDIDENSSEVNKIEIIPETAGQFTGLVVSNGKVFDGDFLKFGAYILEVFWNGESFQWQAGIVGRSYDRRFRCCGEYRNDNWTVIDLGEIAAEPIITGEMTTEIVGNRWDNPELIPQKSECVWEF